MTKTRKMVVMAAGLGFAVYFGSELFSRWRYSQQLVQQTLEESITTVSVTHAVLTNKQQTIVLPGNIEAWFQAPIYAQVSGYVKMWYTDYGAVVKTGDILAQINAPALWAQYDQAKADMEAQRAKAEIADLTAKRYEVMRASNAVPVQEISVKEADARVEKAKLNAALQNVKNYEAFIKFTTIVAPYDGVVTSRDINVGDYVNKEGDLGTMDGGERKGGSSLFTVADIHKMRLFVSVPESFGQFMRPGLTADVVVPQFPNRHFVANFLTVAKAFSASTRTAITEFTIDNEDHALWPGSYASVKLTANVDTNNLVIPATALVFDEKNTQVAVVDDQNRVHFKPIEVVKILDSTVELQQGLTLSDRIVDNPSAALLEGDEVRVVTPAVGYKL